MLVPMALGVSAYRNPGNGLGAFIVVLEVAEIHIRQAVPGGVRAPVVEPDEPLGVAAKLLVLPVILEEHAEPQRVAAVSPGQVVLYSDYGIGVEPRVVRWVRGKTRPATANLDAGKERVAGVGREEVVKLEVRKLAAVDLASAALAGGSRLVAKRDVVLRPAHYELVHQVRLEAVRNVEDSGCAGTGEWGLDIIQVRPRP